MPAASRHSKPKTPAIRLGIPVLAAAALAGVAAAFVFFPGGSAAAKLPGGSAAPKPTHYATAVTTAASGFSSDQVTLDVRTEIASRMAVKAASAARHKYLAVLAAHRLAQRQAAQREAAQQAAQQSAQQQSAAQQSAANPNPTLSSGGGDAAGSSLGACIRRAEEGGSYAWGPGDGGGAYQFQLGTWEKYGGAASEYGVAGPAYQDQIFNNAVAAGGASNWTDYDGC
jgi:hypothetical protein